MPINNTLVYLSKKNPQILKIAVFATIKPYFKSPYGLQEIRKVDLKRYRWTPTFFVLGRGYWGVTHRPS